MAKHPTEAGSASVPVQALNSPAQIHTAPANPPLLVNLGEVATMLGVDRGTASGWASAGILPAPLTRSGKRAFWSRAIITAWAGSAELSGGDCVF